MAGTVSAYITQTNVTTLDNLTEQFHGMKTAPRTAIAGRAGQTKSMTAAVKSLTSILRNRLDDQLVRFRRSHPEFYAG